MIKIILATSNPHKLDEINAINKNPDIVFDVVSGDFDPVEDVKILLKMQLLKQKKLQK